MYMYIAVTYVVLWQVCLEGSIARSSVMKALSQGRRAAGDLIPWTISQQFADHGFAGLSGARVVRIATHPDFQGQGYGSRALRALQDYYEGKMADLSEGEGEGEETDGENRKESVTEVRKSG